MMFLALTRFLRIKNDFSFDFFKTALYSKGAKNNERCNMLVQFSVENYLSFGEETTLSMLPAKSRKQKDHIIHCTKGKSVSVLPLAAFYGANASGKSNFVKAVDFFRTLILGEIDTIKSIPVSLFKLREENTEKPARFEIVFKHEGILYTYGAILSSKQVYEEWLFARYSSFEKKIFERVTDDDGKTKVEAGPILAQSINGKQKAVDLLASILAPRKLFLTECLERGGVSALLKPVLFWFENCLHILSPMTKCSTLPIRAERDEKFLEFFNNFIVASDTGISAIKSMKEIFDADKHLKDVPENFKRHLLGDIDKIKALKTGKNALLAVYLPGNYFNILIDPRGEVFYVQLSIQHKNNKGKDVPFEIFEESDGTQKLMHLTPMLLNALQQEQVYVLDELDCNLHSLLSIAFLKVFLRGITQNGARSQFIFTTHDTNLLDSDLLRRDEILFVEKDKDGCSHITSLADYKVSDGLRIGNGYLYGRFGAIPYLKNMSKF